MSSITLSADKIDRTIKCVSLRWSRTERSKELLLSQWSFGLASIETVLGKAPLFGVTG